MAIDPQPPQFTVQHAQANGCRGVQHLQFGALVLRLPLQFRVAQGGSGFFLFPGGALGTQLTASLVQVGLQLRGAAEITDCP